MASESPWAISGVKSHYNLSSECCPVAPGACTQAVDSVACRPNKCLYSGLSCAVTAGFESSQCCKQPSDTGMCTQEYDPYILCSNAGCQYYDNPCIAGKFPILKSSVLLFLLDIYIMHGCLFYNWLALIPTVVSSWVLWLGRGSQSGALAKTTVLASICAILLFLAFWCKSKQC
jgi:hypothetical protein